MKRLFPILLAIILMFSLIACRSKEDVILQPVNYYYRNAQLTFGAENSLISAKVADAAAFNGDTLAILNDYLNGPDDDRFDVTFPASTKLLQMNLTSGTAYLQMNDSLSRLTGIDLTIACACITKTTMELTGATAVCISTSNELLDGAASITMDESNLILFDNTNVSP